MIDAFSGDGIPLHLITLEALNVYLSRLSQDGIMVFHIFNEYYDLIPVLKAASQERGLEAKATTLSRNNSNPLKMDSMVVVFARNPDQIKSLQLDQGWRVLKSGDGVSRFQIWTDDYVNILNPLLERNLSPKIKSWIGFNETQGMLQ